MSSLNKCNMNTSSQYAYLPGINNDQPLRIDEYIEQKPNLTCQSIFCLNGHELICANGEKNIPHFRHKNLDDMNNAPMTEWHIEWQGNFPATEIEFKKSCEQQIKNRRADVLLSETHVIEIQHSKITKEEVNSRTHDYKLHNKTIIWVVDGNKNILVNELLKSNRVYLEFTTDLWKFESFMDCEFIYIDIGCEIYKIYPNLIKSNMTDVQKPVTKKDFIDSLLNDTLLFTDPFPPQCKLFIKQQGAGNGKTYGIIKMLESDEFQHYKYFIYVSKQHSAVYVIYNEFQQQIKSGILSYIRLDEEPKLVNKKYIIQYYNLKTSNICQIIIGTIDSFMYAIGNKNNTEIDKFEGLVNSIIDGHIETTQNGSIKYGGLTPKLFKETILIGDEEQDLKLNYAKAIIQLMRNRYIDVYIVGDKLQSISNEVNAFTYLLENEFPFIDKTTYEFSNTCRRFNHPKLIHFVNTMIPFEKYGLPSIKMENEDDGLESPVTIFGGRTIYATDTNENRINTEVDAIMKHYESEVVKLCRLPEDFLIVTPFTQKNPLVDALQLAIDIYWRTLNTCCDDFKRYAIFHKSEDGSSINLNESVNATRIVSIHSSKGDGRKVVFVIGLNESGLCIFSGKSDTLIYDSLFHVAITRMKEKLYIRCDGGNDDISRKLQKYLCETGYESSNIEPAIRFDVKFKYIKDDCKTTDNYHVFKDTVFDLINLQNPDNGNDVNDEKKLIDTSHHNVRFAAITIQLYLQIIKKESEHGHPDPTLTKQIGAVFASIIKAQIITVENWKKYNDLLNDNYNLNKIKSPDSKVIPILKLANKGRDYIKYFNIIDSFAKNILIKIKFLLKGKHVDDFCPLECVVLNYMLKSVNQGIFTDFHISEVYNIVDIYSKSFIQSSFRDTHTHCICNKFFTDNEANSNTQKPNNSLESYICVHFEKMRTVSNNYLQFCSLYPNINWLINHPIYFNGKTTDFGDLDYCFGLIGYDKKRVIVAYIKPQFNSLNYNQILMDAVFDTFLIKNIQKYEDNNNKVSENFKKFFGKKITCVVFTTDLNEPYYIDITNEVLEQNEMTTRDIIKESFLSKYLVGSKKVYYFYKYWRKNCSPEITRPLEIIDYIINKFMLTVMRMVTPTNKKPLPNYISEFFNNLKFKIEICNNKQQQIIILKEYDNPKKFIEYLDQRLTDTVNRYFGLNIHDQLDNGFEDDTGFQSD